VTDYAPSEISIMARTLLLAEQEHFVERAKASAVVGMWRRSRLGQLCQTEYLPSTGRHI
jgi:hypothetical protein